MVSLQIAGAPQLLILFLIYALIGLVPVVATLAALYLLYKIRKDTKSMSRSLERIADTRSVRRTGTETETETEPTGSEAVEGRTAGNAEE